MPSAAPTVSPELPAPDESVPILFGLFAPSDLAIVVLTAALVLITAYYALQTRQTVAEMRRARSAAVLPRLAIGVNAPGAGNGWPQVTNVGPGAALEIDARISYLPGGPETVWREHVVAPNQSQEFFPRRPGSTNELIHRLDELTGLYTHIRLVATYRDALGDTHRIDESVEIREWWRAVQEARRRVPRDVAADTVKQLEKIGQQLQSLASDARTLREREEPNPWTWEKRVRLLPPRWQHRARDLIRRFGWCI